MRRFVKGWKTGGHEQRLKARIVNYADDFVICCRGTADEAMAVMQGMMSKLKLTVNETKTRLCRLPEESFDFLGYTIGRCHSPRTGEAYIGPRPSRKSIERFCREISELTERRWASRQVDYQVAEINRKLKGWANYFRLGTVQQSLPARGQPRAVPAPPMAEGQVQGPRSGEDTVPEGLLVRRPGAVQPSGMGRPLSVCEGVIEPCPRAGCLNTGPSGSMSGEWKRGTARLVRHRRPKGPATDRPSLNHRATPRLYGGHKTSLRRLATINCPFTTASGGWCSSTRRETCPA